MCKNPDKPGFYDHFSRDKPTRLGTWLADSVSRRIFDFARIEQGSSVLEIGPGRGGFADICLAKGVEYCAVEPNEKMAEAIEKRGVTVVRSLVPPIPEMGRFFDVVVMNSVMEHMDGMTAALGLAKEIHELLRPGGRFVIYAPDYANWKHYFYEGDFSHNYVTSWRRLEGLLISAGFASLYGCYLSGPFRGPVCFLISGMFSCLPFGWFDSVFPRSKGWHKLYKLQISFLRRVLIVGEKGR